LTLYVHQKKRGSLLLTLAPRVLDLSPDAVERLLTMVNSARRKDSSWAPVEIEIDARSWPAIRQPVEDLVARIVAGWQFPSDQAEIDEGCPSVEAAEDAPVEEPAI
jgi:hypothetical protein